MDTLRLSTHIRKVLVLSSDRPIGRQNDELHRGFFEAAPAEVFWYGDGEHHPVRPFDPAIRLNDLAREIGADLVLVNMRCRVKWARPEDLAAIETPKAMVEVDFCFERGSREEWYRQCRFDAVFMRGYADVQVTGLERVHWLPFSLPPEAVCVPPDDDRRGADVAFIGTVRPDNYPVRYRALQVLGSRVRRSPIPLKGAAYYAWWRQAVFGLTCSCIWRYDNAKHLEIPAAGALLLTDGSAGLDQLLPRAAYELYRPDASDLSGLIDRLLADPDLLLCRRQQAARYVRDHHLHALRWRQLLAHLNV